MKPANISANKPAIETTTKPSAETHRPVFLKETLEIFQGHQGAVRNYFDGTFGRGGHAAAVMKLFPTAKGWMFDRDEDAIQHGKKLFSEVGATAAEVVDQVQFVHADYGEFAAISTRERARGFPENFDLMLLDLGVSSPQLDQGQRGFSFYHDGPLDMRMDRRQETTAAEIVNEWSEQELAKIFIELGEVQRPFRVVRAIVHDRREKPFATTLQLAGLIERVDGWHKKGSHPATRYFMALRLAVNDELGTLERALPELIQALAENGRLVVMTFHSLEDRIVKNVFKAHLDQGVLLNKKVIKPSDEEVRDNPRSRSAKLRAFEKGSL